MKHITEARKHAEDVAAKANAAAALKRQPAGRFSAVPIFIAGTGPRPLFRVFENAGAGWWRLLATYGSRGKAEHCVQRLMTGQQEAPKGKPPRSAFP